MTGLFASVFSANVYLTTVPAGYFDPEGTLNPFLHLWTLGVEEQFYVLFPALLIAGWWLARRVGRVGRCAVVLAVVGTSVMSFLLALHFARSGAAADQRLAFYGSPTRAWEFGVGALAALPAPWVARMPGAVAQLVGVLGLAAVGVAAFSSDNASGLPVIATLLAVGGACALLAAGTATERNVASRLLSVRPAVWVGDLSYSWYLWHWPLIVFATALWPRVGWTALTLAAVSLLPAWLSYRYVENPIRLDSRIVGRRVFALLAVCVVVPLAASLGLRETDKALASTSRVKAFERSQTAHLDVAAGCESSALDDPPACTWGKKGRQGQVVLLGDSNAGQFSESVVRAAKRANLQARISTKAYCPFIDLSVLRDEKTWEQKECRVLYERNLATLVRSRPSLVIVAARTDMYLDGSEFGLARTDTGTHVHRTAAKERLWSQGLQSTIRRLNGDGIPVIVVHPVPELPTRSTNAQSFAS